MIVCHHSSSASILHGCGSSSTLTQRHCAMIDSSLFAQVCTTYSIIPIRGSSRPDRFTPQRYVNMKLSNDSENFYVLSRTPLRTDSFFFNSITVDPLKHSLILSANQFINSHFVVIVEIDPIRRLLDSFIKDLTTTALDGTIHFLNLDFFLMISTNVK